MRIPALRCLLTVLITASASDVRLSAADWTEFRGPTGQGMADSRKLPTSWSESTNIRWKVAIAGLGWSSPVVADGRIFLTTAVPVGEAADSPHELRAICLNADDGTEIWNVEVFQHPAAEKVEVHPKNSHASPTPILDGQRLFVHFGPHGTACLTTEGAVVWKNEELRYAPRHGNGGSPALSDGRLIISCDGMDTQFVAALDKQTGQTLWRTPRDTTPAKGFSFCTPTIIDVNGVAQAVCPGSSAVFAYDPASGREIWRVDYGEGFSVVPRPLFGHGLVFVCTGFGDEQLLAIDPSGEGNITSTHVKWSTTKATPKSPSPILVGDHLFFISDGGIASCVDAKTGELRWHERINGNYSASPTFAGGLLYFQSETGITTVVEASDKFRQVTRNELGDGMLRTFASFAVVDDAILLRSESHLYRIEDGHK